MKTSTAVEQTVNLFFTELLNVPELHCSLFRLSFELFGLHHVCRHLAAEAPPENYTKKRLSSNFMVLQRSHGTRAAAIP